MTHPWSDADRIVELDDEPVTGPAGEESGPSGVREDERLIEDRPPHWDR